MILLELKNIKVTEKVKAELDAAAFDKETYNVTIERILRENKRLAIENLRLKYDKDFLMKMVLKDESLTDLGVEYKFVPFITSVLFENDLSDAERLEYLKKYFTEIADADKSVIMDCILIVKESCDVSDGALMDFEKWINENVDDGDANE